MAEDAESSPAEGSTAPAEGSTSPAEGSASSLPERLFHLVLPGAWAAADPAAAWAPPSLASEGFVHLSFAHQRAGTLAAHFAATGESLWLLEVDAAALGPELVLEPSRGGQDFPHLYRALARAEVLGHWPLRREADGTWRLPDLAHAADADDPARALGAPQSP